MTPACEQAVEEVGNGIGASLRGVDCIANDMTQAAFGRLFGTDGAFAPVLTVLLTLYLVFFGYALITGRSSIGVRSLIPRMVTIGLVLTFTTSWLAYQSYVWSFTTAAPDQIATVLTGSEGPATQVFGDKIDIVLAAIQEATGQAGQQGGEAGQAVGNDISTFSPKGLMWLGATLLLLGTVGVLVTARIALAVLVALGPIFIVLSLFPATRGMFTGWLKGLVMLAITPLFAVLGGTMMLELAVPVITSLSPLPGQIDPRAAMAFFMIGAVHVALMFLVLKVSGTMVSGWRVFGFAERAPRDEGSVTVAATTPAATVAATQRAAVISGQPASQAPNRTVISGVSATVAANDTTAGPAIMTRETRIVAATGSGGSQSIQANSGKMRARGIGSRFRSAPSRTTEKVR
jgi:type IV secretion system protein VirB6